MPFNTNTYRFTANQPTSIGQKVNCLLIEEGLAAPFATGPFTVKCDNGDFKARPGTVYRFDTQVTIQTITSAVTEVIEVTIGNGAILLGDLAGSSGGFVTIVNVPLPVQGSDPPLTVQATLAGFDNPLNAGHLKDSSGVWVGTGPWTNTPNRGDDIYQFTTGVNHGGALYSTPQSMPSGETQVSRTAMLSVTGAGIIGSTELLVRVANIPMPIFRGDGTFFSNGVIPVTVAANDVFYVPLTGIAGPLDITTAGTFWTVAVTSSPDFAIPSRGGASKRTFARLDGALAAGATTIVAAVVGQRCHVYGYAGSLAAVGVFDFRNAGGVIASVQYQATTDFQESDTEPLFIGATNTAMQINLGVANSGSVQLRYEMKP